MRAVVQRVTEADVTVEGQVAGKIDKGLMVLLGVEEGDTERYLQSPSSHCLEMPERAKGQAL